MADRFVLLPQLMPGDAASLANEIGNLGITDLRRKAEIEDLEAIPAIYSPTGGNKIRLIDLKDLAHRIRKNAESCGYPETGRTARVRRDFDSTTAELLHSSVPITVNEASRKGVWEFFSCVLLPDVVRWRFWEPARPTHPERFMGGVRNTFQRMWRRAFVLYDPDTKDPYGLMRFLLEDELVQITERPQLSASRMLARATVNAFRTTLTRYPDVNREDLFRDAQKRLIRKMPLICFEALEPALIEAMLLVIFADAAGMLKPVHPAMPDKSGSAMGIKVNGIRSILGRFKGSKVGAGTQ